MSFFVGLLLVAAVPGPLQTLGEAVRLAATDAASLGERAGSCRYIWLGNNQDPEIVPLLNFTINSLSRRRILVPLSPVHPGLFRLDLSAYSIDSEAWDDLGAKGSGPTRSAGKADNPEPYFHMTVTRMTEEFTERLVDCPPFRHSNGNVYNQKWVKESTGKKTTKTETVHGPWLPQAELQSLVLACGTDFPIYRADWFITYAWLAPAYQKLLGVKERTDFDKLVRYRERDLDLSVKGIVLFSSAVSTQNRSLLRTPTSLGYYWESSDHLTSVNQNDLLNDVLGNRADAHGIIASAPNGLQQYLITNGQNKIIDFGDPNVVIDRRTPWHNRLVWCGFSCVSCHTTGLWEFKDDVRTLAGGKANSVFAIVREKDSFRFQDLFGPDHRQLITADQAIYARSIQTVSGLTPEKISTSLTKTVVSYLQEPVTLAQVERECGYTKDQIQAVLTTATGLDHTLTQLLVGSPVRREQWERSSGQLAILLGARKP